MIRAFVGICLLFLTSTLTAQLLWEQTYGAISTEARITKVVFNGTHFGLLGYQNRPPLGASAPVFWLVDTLGQVLAHHVADLPDTWEVDPWQLVADGPNFYALCVGNRDGRTAQNELHVFRFSETGVVPLLYEPNSGRGELYQLEMTVLTDGSLLVVNAGSPFEGAPLQLINVLPDGTIRWTKTRDPRTTIVRVLPVPEADHFALLFYDPARTVTQFVRQNEGTVTAESIRTASDESCALDFITGIGIHPSGALVTKSRYDCVTSTSHSWFQQIEHFYPNGSLEELPAPSAAMEIGLRAYHQNETGPYRIVSNSSVPVPELRQFDWSYQLTEKTVLPNFLELSHPHHFSDRIWYGLEHDSVVIYDAVHLRRYGFPLPELDVARQHSKLHDAVPHAAGFALAGSHWEAGGVRHPWYARTDGRGNVRLQRPVHTERTTEPLALHPLAEGGFFAVELAPYDDTLYGHWMDVDFRTQQRSVLNTGSLPWNPQNRPAQIRRVGEKLLLNVAGFYFVLGAGGQVLHELNWLREYGTSSEGYLTDFGRMFIIGLHDQVHRLREDGSPEQQLDPGDEWVVRPKFVQLADHPNGLLLAYRQDAPEGGGAFQYVTEVRNEYGTQILERYVGTDRFRAGDMRYTPAGMLNLTHLELLRYRDTTVLDLRANHPFAHYGWQPYGNAASRAFQVLNPERYDRTVPTLRSWWLNLPLAEGLPVVPRVNQLELAPNPNRGTFRWRLAGRVEYPLRVRVVDAAGRIRQSIAYDERPGSDTFLLHAPLLTEGIYFLLVEDAAAGRWQSKFVVVP